ncbi:exosortase F system-associated protein [Flavobacterium sp.]|uniref:exosortase F system-associated membrane protein n=1 Tax=Flavobacterium sp. TaxID=239 RepID=UPI002618E41C|nr:exosortase F system-associated protein [Flavobacterium sp.]MDG2432789.1 exosortase F system-associated protein [Flavobacterium sp.]
MRFFLAAVLLFLLVLIRAYENILFYDPFLLYFKGDFNSLEYPIYNLVPFIASLVFRYGLNSVLSIGIIYLLFQDKLMIKFVAFLYALFFVFLLISFFVILYCNDFFSSWSLFYVRRFIIQPIFLVLFIPALYYQKVTRKI